MGYARLVGGGLGETDLEVAVEKAILRGVKKLDTYDPDKAAFTSWLRPLVRHAIGDLRRSKGADNPELPADVAETGEPDPELPAPTEAALRRALQRLSETDQLILALRVTEQLSYDQIAERIGGVTPGACRVRHLRALRRLAGEAAAEPELHHYMKDIPT
ncbi:MAG: sigma-70 family RNA polymerase sigma factor [Actinobacteria bacterium]|nr:sigma-70 family RNA polymerase sigma factor [Actinomycetota bacterium]